jgi:hypothetical protein
MAKGGKSLVIQSGAKAGGDIVGGDKVTNVIASKPGVVEQLLHKLQHEIDNSIKVKTVAEELRRYYARRAHDGIEGLEAKLKHADREHELFTAMERKEEFAKTLEKWAHYATAQEIFVYLLARAEVEFTQIVLPQIGDVPAHVLNELVTTRIVNPIVEDCAPSVFKINHGAAMGMFYWLAEQCFVRWHK